jgi:uncharacterized protein YbjT (DUF2867 family)
MGDSKVILVVGATGQLGTAVVRKLAAGGQHIRALVRPSSNYQHLKQSDIDIVFGDLRDAKSLDEACQNIDTVIATANSAVPREPGDSFKTVDNQGYKNLIEACQRQGVRQFIFTSVLAHPAYDRMPLPQQKRVTEQRLQNSGLEYTIFRADAFMDVIFPLMGSDLLLRGSEAATVKRPFWFSKRFFNSVKDNIASKGEVGIVGDGTTRRTYICIDDVAEFHVKAINHPQSRNTIFELGGPEALSQNDVFAIFQNIFNKPLKAKYTAAAIFKVGHRLLKPFSPAAANIMGVNYSAATIDSVIDMSQTARIFDVKLTSAEEFIRQKLNDPEPVV